MAQLPRLLLLAQLASALCDPLAQSQRPPQQTTVQSAAQATLVANAGAQSHNARDWVLNYLKNEVLPELQGTELGGMSGEDLLEMLDWEFKRLPIIHNGPLDASDQAKVQDDTDLATTMANGYLQNVCQRRVLGAASQRSLVKMRHIMTEYMALPEFARGEDNPTLREANSCVMYLATNLRKTHCGNFLFGSVTCVINPIYRDKFAVMPFDSGAFASRYPSDAVFGTLEDYYHVFKSHVTVLKYNFASVLRRWYDIDEPPPQLATKLPFMEIEWMGNAWFPESILYVIVKFSGGAGTGVWGTELGRTLQDSMRFRGRPVLWANGDDSGMLIDGTVNMIEGGRIGQEAWDYFNSHWDSGISWQDFYNYSPEYLKFFYPRYERRQLCEQVEQNPSYMVMGHDRLGNCVYWAWNSFPSKWECLNDGNCEVSDSDRAVFSSEQECLQNCGWGKWACVQNAPGARSGAHHCEPNSNLGECNDVDTCEATCESSAARQSQPRFV